MPRQTAPRSNTRGTISTDRPKRLPPLRRPFLNPFVSMISDSPSYRQFREWGTPRPVLSHEFKVPAGRSQGDNGSIRSRRRICGNLVQKQTDDACRRHHRLSIQYFIVVLDHEDVFGGFPEDRFGRDPVSDRFAVIDQFPVVKKIGPVELFLIVRVIEDNVCL